MHNPHIYLCPPMSPYIPLYKHTKVIYLHDVTCSRNKMNRYTFANEMNTVAETIHRQIKTSRLPNEPFMTNFFKVVKSGQMLALEDGLQFRVRGDKFDGKVVIKLNAMDTYDIEFWNIQLGPDDLFICEKVDEIKDVYNDMLLETLWNRIVVV